MQILQLLSLLLDYPQHPMVDGKDDLLSVVANATIDADHKQQLTGAGFPGVLLSVIADPATYHHYGDGNIGINAKGKHI